MSFKVINFESINTPKAVESPAKEWVGYGEDNDYFTYLIDRCNGSAVSNAIISSVSDQIYGEGLAATDSNKKPLDFAKMRTIFKGEDIRRVSGDLKKLGMGAFNIIWNKGKTQVLRSKHIPMQNLRPEKATDGEIKAWYYSDNWVKYRKKAYEPKRIETFTGAKGEESQILVIAPYSAGFFYFSPVDYVGALPWSEIDEEIANYHKTNIINGFSPTMLVNFNNGLPTEDEQQKIERSIGAKLTGTGGKKWLTSWNDDSSTATTIETIPISEASEQYKFLSEESTQKILIGHKVTSPMLFGIKDSAGLGNNADEIKTASQLFDNTVIKPKQNMIIDAVNSVLAVNNIVLDVYIKTIQPIEFIETEDLNVEEVEKETGVKMCENFSKEDEKEDFKVAAELISLGEELSSDEWELIADEDAEEHEELMAYEFASTGVARPNSKSEQDRTINGFKYKVRYSYAPLNTSSNSREFCRKMVGADKLYRKEDLIAMGDKAVNAGWGKDGADLYSVWKYKGGGGCHHKFRRKTFKSKFGIDTKSPLAPTISTGKSDKEGYRIRNDKEVAMKPVDMINKGFIKKR